MWIGERICPGIRDNDRVAALLGVAHIVSPIAAASWAEIRGGAVRSMFHAFHAVTKNKVYQSE
jgi:hypothetical protein